MEYLAIENEVELIENNEAGYDLKLRSIGGYLSLQFNSDDERHLELNKKSLTFEMDSPTSNTFIDLITKDQKIEKLSI